MTPAPAHSIYRFGDFELDTLKRLLVSRITGQPVDITGRVVEALLYLVERPGQLVEKKALIDALWPHVVVEEGNLSQTIHTLRRALGERAGEDRYIATVPGRGYRFVAEVSVRTPAITVDDPPPRQPAKALAWSLVAIAAVFMVVLAIGIFIWRDSAQPQITASVRPVAATAPPSIAVLPFVDMSPAQDQTHFAEGLSEEILNMLTRADELRVIARTSSFSFKDQNADIRTIAQRLTVSHVLEGSVRKAGERVRVTAQLIDASNSAHVWSDTFDRDLTDIFGVQSEIAMAVAEALHVTLRSPKPTRAETSSTQAYEHYLQGRHLFNRRAGTDLMQAKAHFEAAVELDPDYGRAWAALAGVYLVAQYEGPKLPDAMRHWGTAAKRATELAPDLAEAHMRAAQYYWHANDPVTGDWHRSRAMMLDPHEPLLFGVRASKGIDEGRLDEVIETQKELVAADPLSATRRSNLGSYLLLAGRYEEAQQEFERALELSPNKDHTVASLADVLVLQGRHDEALAVTARIPPGYAREQRLALIHFSRGEAAEGEPILESLSKQAMRPDADYEMALAVAEIHAVRNDLDGAFTWLDNARRRAETQHAPVAPWLLYEDLQISPYLKSLQSDPRWQPLRPPEKGTQAIPTARR